MFEKNGMRMSKEHILEFFRVLDADKSGGLSIGEFKEFLFSEKCRDSNLFFLKCVGFRILMRKVREEQQRILLESTNEEQIKSCSYGSYTPFTFEEMLQYIHKFSKRNSILNQIKE